MVEITLNVVLHHRAYHGFEYCPIYDKGGYGKVPQIQPIIVVSRAQKQKSLLLLISGIIIHPLMVSSSGG